MWARISIGAVIFIATWEPVEVQWGLGIALKHARKIIEDNKSQRGGDEAPAHVGRAICTASADATRAVGVRQRRQGRPTPRLRCRLQLPRRPWRCGHLQYNDDGNLDSLIIRYPDPFIKKKMSGAVGLFTSRAIFKKIMILSEIISWPPQSKKP